MSPQDFINRFSPKCFFHFTDTRNLPSIRENGLLPLAEIRRLGVKVPAAGGNDWSHEQDELRGLDGYVHLCLIEQHPMEWFAREKEKRLEETCFIQVATDVIHWDGIRFTAEVANRSGSTLLTVEEACKTMDFAVVYDRTNWKDPSIQKRRAVAKKYELLVPSVIATQHLRF